MLLSAPFLLLLATSLAASVQGARAPDRMLHTSSSVCWEQATALHALTLHNISGVWEGYGDQYTAAEWGAFMADNTLPNCTQLAAHGEFTYKHWGEVFPDMVAIAAGGANSTGGSGINGHHSEVYQWSAVQYKGGELHYSPDWADEPACTRFVPYVDNRNGMVFAKMMSKAEWRRVNATTVVRKDLGCNVQQDEVAGCYPQGANVVHTVAVTTYRCKAGACLNFSPAYLEAEDGQ